MAPAPQVKLLLFAKEPEKTAFKAGASSLVFSGGPETRRAAERKQKSAVPPGRRVFRQPAVLASKRGGKRGGLKSHEAGSQEGHGLKARRRVGRFGRGVADRGLGGAGATSRPGDSRLKRGDSRREGG